MADQYDLVVIGGGSAGLTIGRYGPKLGARIAVVEEGKLGDDCTWYGCVPSKALLASAKVASLARHSEEFGLPPLDAGGNIDLGPVMDRVAAVQRQIYETDDSPESLRAAGSDVIEGRGEFVSPRELRVDGRPVRSRYYCVATGSRPIVPEIPGLDTVPHYTNESVFSELRELPARLLVLGAGPIGVELGQAFARLGSRVTIVEAAPRILPREDGECAAVLHESLVADGMTIASGTRATRFSIDGGHRCAVLERGGREEQIEIDAVLVAVGTRPNVHGVGLDAAGVEYSERGVTVDARLRTSNPRIYASGDVLGRQQFTHTAAHESSIVLTNVVTPIRAKVDYRLVPAVTFTDPEVASIGFSDEEARAAHGGDVRVFRFPFSRTDRAITDGETRGFAKVVTAGRKDRIVGAQIVGPAAGELIHECALAIQHRMGAVDLGHAIHAYPTLANAPQHAAGRAFDARLQRTWVQAMLRGYGRLSRLLAR